MGSSSRLLAMCPVDVGLMWPVFVSMLVCLVLPKPSCWCVHMPGPVCCFLPEALVGLVLLQVMVAAACCQEGVLLSRYLVRFHLSNVAPAASFFVVSCQGLGNNFQNPHCRLVCERLSCCSFPPKNLGVCWDV